MKQEPGEEAGLSHSVEDSDSVEDSVGDHSVAVVHPAVHVDHHPVAAVPA